MSRRVVAREPRADNPLADWVPRELRLVDDAPDRPPRAAGLEHGFGDGWDRSGIRPTKTITGRPNEARQRPARSRTSTTQARFQSRPDRAARWAVLLGMVMIFMAIVTAQADASGYRSGVTLGDRALKKGMKGQDVRTLQRLLIWRDYRISGVSGRFGSQTKAAVKRFQRRHRLRADGVAGARTIRVFQKAWPRKRATWYGPGLYGNGLACGGSLRHSTYGVAHKWLRCGTKVRLAYAGRVIIVPVIDRGPFVSGVALDLTERTKKALRMPDTATLRAGY